MSLEICHRHFDDRRSGCLDLFLGHGIKPRSLTVVVRRDESAVDVDRVDGARGRAPFQHFGDKLCDAHDDLISSPNGNRLMSIMMQ